MESTRVVRQQLEMVWFKIPEWQALSLLLFYRHKNVFFSYVSGDRISPSKVNRQLHLSPFWTHFGMEFIFCFFYSFPFWMHLYFLWWNIKLREHFLSWRFPDCIERFVTAGNRQGILNDISNTGHTFNHTIAAVACGYKGKTIIKAFRKVAPNDYKVAKYLY